MEAYDNDGNKYYYNTITGESSWEIPVDYIEVTPVYENYDEHEVNDVIRIGDWMQQFTEDGHIYWTHEITGESTWETPIDDKDFLFSYNSQDHSQSDPISMYTNSKVSAGDYSIEL
jgi:hypothetical protein